MVTGRTCPSGTYLANVNDEECTICPAGYYCPGGAVSADNSGKIACDESGFNPKEGGKTKDACISCGTAVKQVLTQEFGGPSYKITGDNYADGLDYFGYWNGMLSNLTGVDENAWFKGVNINNVDFSKLVTTDKAQTSIKSCGYYCVAKKHAARGTYTCEEPCEANHYCPAGGRYPDYDGRYEPVYYRKHLLWYDPKEWMFDCPVGLVSDPNSAHCKISHCEAGYYARSTGRKWLSSADGYACRNINDLTVKYNEITNKNDCVEYTCDVECSGHTGCDEEWDASISVCRAINDGHIIDGITTEADCTTVGGEWKLGVCKNKSDGSIIGDRVTKKSCEHTNCNTYFYCPESNNIDVMLEYYDESRHTPAWHDTGSTYNLNTCSGGQMAATAPASSCYAKPYTGSVQNRPSTYNVCNALDSSCPLEGNGWRKCPAGSVATGEASSINDCKCLSDIDLLDGQVPQYRPNGVYAEKGASLQYDPYSGETVCVNTYLVVNDSTIYEDVKATGVNEASVSDANARVVTCQWVSDDSVSTDLQQTTGKYKKCTDQALRVCKLNDWLGDIEPTTVTHESVFVNFAETLYGHDTDEVKMAKIYDVFENHMATVSDISDIAYGDCSGTGAMYNIKYDVTEANYTDGTDPNPHAYGSTSLPISLVNPTVNTGYVFDGWCKYNSSADALEGKDTCTVECSNDNAEKCKVNKQNELGDVVALGTESVGHKWFNAIWKPAEYTITLNATENTGSPNYTLFEEYGVRWFVGAEDTCQITEEQNFTCLPTKNDAVFTGYWSEISEGTQVISNTGNILVPTTYFTADTTIYAQFMPCEAPVSGITTEAPILTVTDNKCAWVAACKTGYTSNTMVSVNDTDVPGVSVVGEYGTATVNALTDCDIIPYTITYEGVSGDDISWPKNPLDETEELHNVELYYVTSSDINLVNPTKTGYDFDGWCKYNSDSVPESGQDECLTECSDEVTTGCKVAVQSTENDVVAIASGSTGNKTFYAVWKPTTYTVTYNGLEGATFEDGEENPDKYTVKSEDIALFNPIKTGYVFDGWCKYNSDSVPESGQDECLVECSDEVTTGCKVAVQSTENDVIAIASGSTGNWVFTAKWHSSDCPAGFPKGNVLDGCYATIHYVQNCGQLGEGEENPTRYDAETILPITLYNPTKAHYTFDGWCLNGEDDETCLANTVEVTVDSETGEETRTIKRVIPVGTTGNITFVAKCTPTTYTIVFNANGGGGEMVPMTVKYDEEVNLMTNMFTKSGYSFAGWCDKLVEGTNTCAEDAHKYIDGESVLNLVDVYDTDTITLYAIWTPNLYTVTFDSNTSDTFVSGTKLDMVCTYGMACDIKNDNEITINDYEFVGWMTQPDGTAAEYTDSVTFETELPENKITLYALWRPVCVAGKRLHIGDTSMCMYTNKRTSPSVAIMLGDDKYYVNMCKSSECDNTMNNETEQKLHIKYNEETYNVYDLTAQ